MIYGEIIIGPPGSGKSTYTEYKKELLKNRNVHTINLDPGNNITSFDYDIKKIAQTKEYMEKNKTGPNYTVKCILAQFLSEYESNFLPFLRKIVEKEDECYYFLFDFPGQVEFFMINDTLKEICKKLEKEMNFQFVCVNLVDSVFFLERQSLISTYLCSTIAMILLEMPHICVMSKCDNLKNLKGIVDKNIDLEEIVCCFDIFSQTDSNFQKNCLEIVNNESLLNFEFLDYENEDTLMYLQMIIDKATGFFYNENTSYEPVGKFQLIDYYNNILTDNKNFNESIENK